MPGEGRNSANPSPTELSLPIHSAFSDSTMPEYGGLMSALSFCSSSIDRGAPTMLPHEREQHAAAPQARCAPELPAEQLIWQLRTVA